MRNQAKYGGGVYLHRKAGINISKSAFSDNFAMTGGAAIYTGNSDYGDRRMQPNIRLLNLQVM